MSNIVFSADTNTISNQITLNNTSNIKDANILFVGMYAYSESLLSCTTITNIIDSTTVEISLFPSKTGTFDTTFSDLVPYKYLELCESLKDVAAIVNSNGQFVQLTLRNENNIIRDKHEAIRARDREISYNIKAYPIIYNPTQDQIERAGFKETLSAIVWFATKDLFDKGINFNDFDEIRDTVKINNETFKITEKNRLTQMGNEWLYTTLGLVKK